MFALAMSACLLVPVSRLPFWLGQRNWMNSAKSAEAGLAHVDLGMGWDGIAFHTTLGTRLLAG